ncbi:MAG: tetratricopeptide repeat protein, partial [Verrucomicrobiota bacterium]
MSKPRPVPTRAAASGRPRPDLDSLRREARVASEREDWSRAVSLWQAVRDHRPRDIEAIGNLGLIAKNRGQLDQAETLWREAIAIAPRNAGLHGNLAEIYRLRFRARQAEETTRAALRLAPDKADLRLALGNILWDQRKIAEALEAANSVPDEGPLGASAANLRGNINSHLGRGAEARREYARALALRPDYPQYDSNLLLALLYDEHLGADEVFAAHRSVGRKYDMGRPGPVPADIDPARPLRVAFLSADFRIHSVAYFVEP